MQSVKGLILRAVLAVGLVAGAASAGRAEPSPQSVALGAVKWQPLIPQLGAKSPQFSVVFGDMKHGPVGLLLKFPAGFTPGPHTHSSDYWGVVIEGEISDFSPGQRTTAPHLAAGGHWMEPAGRPHDNECSSRGECIGFAYFPNGFDVKPIKK